MTEQSPTLTAKRKQYAFAALIVVGIGLASAAGVFFSSPQTNLIGIAKKQDIKTKSYIAPGEKVEPQDAWRGVADNRLALLESQIKSLETENRTLNERSLNKPGAIANPGKPAGTTPASTEDDIDKRLREYQKTAPPSAPVYPSGPVPGAVIPRINISGKIPQGPGAQTPGSQLPGGQVPIALPKPLNGIQVVTLSPSPNGAQRSELQAPTPGASGTPGVAGTPPDHAKPPKTAHNYLPTGMFGQAIMLAGMDAPTGGQSQQNPHPLLLQLRKPGVLPNGFRQDWDSCHISASGYGDISSERAYIRTESLSCLYANGDIVDVELKGYIVGEDGKAGMRGRLVSKQGQALANALLAGVVSGIGSGFEKSTQITSTSALGTTSSTKPGEEYAAGIGTGVGKALDRLANYYITLAEKLFPVIEVDAGRTVDIVLTKGVYLDGKTH